MELSVMHSLPSECDLILSLMQTAKQQKCSRLPVHWGAGGVSRQHPRPGYSAENKHWNNSLYCESTPESLEAVTDGQMDSQRGKVRTNKHTLLQAPGKTVHTRYNPTNIQARHTGREPHSITDP